MKELVPEEKGVLKMNNNQAAIRSGGFAIVFFSVASSATAFAAALLPFIIR
jgi:hypothetical protein